MQDLYGAAGYFSEVKGSLKRKRTCVSPLTPLNYYLKQFSLNTQREHCPIIVLGHVVQAFLCLYIQPFFSSVIDSDWHKLLLFLLIPTCMLCFPCNSKNSDHFPAERRRNWQRWLLQTNLQSFGQSKRCEPISFSIFQYNINHWTSTCPSHFAAPELCCFPVW